MDTATSPAVASPAQPEIPESARIIEMLAGFQYSQALYVVAKIGLSTALVQGPKTIEELAAATGAKADVISRLVRSLAPLGLFRTEDGKVEATSLGLLLAEDYPESARDMALFFMETHYAPFGEFLHTAMTGEDASTHYYGMGFLDWTASSPAATEILTRAMASAARGMRAGMFDGYSLPAGNRVADLGGADGSIMCELLRHEPGRCGVVFDKPGVVPAAREVLSQHGLADRVDTQAGDFFQAVPAADVYVLSFILHDWDHESCLRILRSIKNAAAPGARLVVIEQVIPPGDTPHPAKLIDLTMMVITGGRERTAEEYEQLLDEGGFTLDRIVPTPTTFSFIEATLR